MCGLVAVIGKPSYLVGKAFDQLLQIDVIRGPHSTGVCAVTDKNIFIQKSLWAPTDMIESDKYQKRVVKKRNDIICYLGHNRHATSGRIIKRNAHPFQHSHITLIHNGTLHKHIKYGKEEFETDSESICHSIARQGARKTWKNLDGAAALIWWDSRDKSLNVLKNNKRPLFFKKTEDEQQIFFASEDWMINGICERNNIVLGSTLWRPNDNVLFKFKYDEKTKKVDYTSEHLDPFTYVFANHNRRDVHYDDWGQAGFQGAGEAWPKASYEKEKEKNKKSSLKIKNTVDTHDLPFYRYCPIENGYILKEGYMVYYDEIIPIADFKAKKAERQAKKTQSQNQKAIFRNGFEQSFDDTVKTMTEEEFKKNYSDCIFCNEPLAEHYEDSVIVDTKCAVCPDCVKTSEIDELNVFNMASSI